MAQFSKLHTPLVSKGKFVVEISLTVWYTENKDETLSGGCEQIGLLPMENISKGEHIKGGVTDGRRTVDEHQSG